MLAAPALERLPLYQRLDLITGELRQIGSLLGDPERARIEGVEREIAAILASTAPALTPLAEWLPSYREILQDRGLAAATLRNREAVLGPLSERLGAIPIGGLRTYDLARFVRAYIQRGTLHAARYARTVLLDLFGEAASDGLVDHNPALSLRPIRTTVRRRRLTLSSWWKARARAEQMSPWVSDAMDLAMVTGQRRAEIAAARFDHVRGRYLHVTQAKTGTRLRLHLDIRLDALGLSIGDAIERCRAGAPGDYLIRHREGRGKIAAGDPLHRQTLSNRFADIMRQTIKLPAGIAPTFGEQRSLSARLYNTQGRNPQALLGHRRAATTDLYLDARGVEWIEVR